MPSKPSMRSCSPTSKGAAPLDAPRVGVVQDVAHERGLAGARHAGQRDEPPERHADRQVLQVVLARADDGDRALGAAEGHDAGGGRPLAPDRHGRRRGAARGGRGLRPPPQQLAGGRVLHAREGARGSGEEDLPAAAARVGAEVDHVVGGLDGLGIVLDDDHGVAAVGQPPQDREQAARVGGVQADRRLVEDVQRSGQRAAERRREADALRLAARERPRRARERQVLEADVVHVVHARPQLRDDGGEPRLLRRREHEPVEEDLQVPQRQLHEIGDRPAAEADPEGRRREARAAAGAAERVGAVARQQHADVDLVALGLEPVEEPLDAVEVAAPLDQDLALVRRQPRHRHVGPHRVAPAGAEEVVVRGLVRRRVPRRDRALREREAAVGDRLLEVHADHAPEPLAGRAGAERGVESEERRRRVAKLPPAARAMQPAPEGPHAVLHARLEGAGQRERGLGRGRDLGPRCGPDDEAAHDEPQTALGVEQRRGRRPRSRRSRPRATGPGRTRRACTRPAASRRWPRFRRRPAAGASASLQPTGATSTVRAPSSAAHSSSTARSTPPGTASTPQSGQTVVPPWAKSSRSESWISVCVPTVERALRTPFFCSSAIAGGTGSIESTSGRSSRSRNWRA